ncbi:hypothetical protein [Amycolatopsis sp. cmx-4-54]|uniref:hypothetical protein n=1 Tax=Amycolatopsis sp. cmx-4-54 TaxID=2790936 RepID=UPI00397B38CF
MKQELGIIAKYPPLIPIWDQGLDEDPQPRLTVGQHRAALGAIELALRDSYILDGVKQHDRWRTIDGHIDRDWVGGPYAWEVARELLYFAENPDTSTIEPGELVPGVNALGELNAVWFDGVRVRFRPFRPGLRLVAAFRLRRASAPIPSASASTVAAASAHRRCADCLVMPPAAAPISS